MLPDIQQNDEGNDEDLNKALRGFLARRSYILQAGIAGEDGKLIASALGSGCSPPNSDALQKLMHELIQDYPRSPIRRLIIEDSLGTVIAAPTSENRVLVVITEPDAKLGSVSMNVERFLRTLNER